MSALTGVLSVCVCVCGHGEVRQGTSAGLPAALEDRGCWLSATKPGKQLHLLLLEILYAP